MKRQQICVIIIKNVADSVELCKNNCSLYLLSAYFHGVHSASWKEYIMAKTIRILGIDPGYAIVGFGVLDYDGIRFTPVEYGAVLTEANTPFPERLRAIHEDIEYIFDKFRPECMAIERLYFTTNQKTAIDVAQARGVTVLSAAKRNIPVSEYTPLQVKQSVVGYGKAEKHQVMEMTRQLLGLAQIPRPDDAADALAIAICHGHSTRFR